MRGSVGLTGRVVVGMGKAAAAQRSEACRDTVDAWARAAGWRPIPGSLNVVLEDRLPDDTLLPCRGRIWFRSTEASVLAVRLRGTRQGQVLELVAPVVLRDHLGLVTGDQVQIVLLPWT